MFTFCLGIAVGLLVAWNVWPQPKWMKDLYTKALATLHAKKVP